MAAIEADARTRIETARLVLRAPVDSDVEAIVAQLSDPAVTETTARIPHPYGPDDAMGWIADCRLKRDAGSGLGLAIERRADRAFIGTAGIHEIGSGAPAILGYWIGRPYWRQGYATEAARGLLGYVFAVLAVERVHASVYPGNPASLRVLAKLGFRVVGPIREPAPARGGERDAILHEIRADEWRG
jgi:8-oxo-dGTP diphosphatase